MKHSINRFATLGAFATIRTLATLGLLAPFAAASGIGDGATLVVRDGRVFDSKTQTLHERADLWIAGERIVGEKPLGDAAPDGAKIVEAHGATLLPGLFDLHTHVSVSGSGMERMVVVPALDELRSQLYCGVTNVVDLHADENTIFELRKRSRSGHETARLSCAGAAFTVPGGHGTQFGMVANEVTSSDDVNERFDALLAKKPDVIKAILEHGGWAKVPALPTLSPELFAAIGARSKAAGLPLFAHIWTADEALTAVNGGANVLAHGVFVGAVSPELVLAMKKNSVAYVPTLAVVVGALRCASGKSPYANELARGALYPDVFASVTSKDAKTWATAGDFARGERTWFANLKRVADAGLEIGTGTDAGNPLTPHGPALIEELALYVEAGLSPGRALSAATLGSAKILRVERDFGSLEPGKIADVVIVDGDPTSSIQALWKIRDVIEGGALVDRKSIADANAVRARAPVKKVAGKDVPALIDSFDDASKSGWGASWIATSDSKLGGKSSGSLSIANGALHVKGALAVGFPYGPFAGAALFVDPERKTVVDASNYDGFALRIRGTERFFNFIVHRASVKDFNVFSAVLDVTSEWTDVKIPFDQLKQVGVGAVVPWAASDFTGVEIDARVPYGTNEVGDFEFELDSIALYRNG